MIQYQETILTDMQGIKAYAEELGELENYPTFTGNVKISFEPSPTTGDITIKYDLTNVVRD